ncbi:hypothetical protein AGMMS50225_19960 [Betaproteobacteria bacterium]|nr:hypothetical protein AGMMS50225_19960 [Betaproteobacteria bacterium]
MVANANIIREGELEFSFSQQGLAEKYDSWAHYRNQFQSSFGGSKAVDFLYVEKGTVWMLEVKDYRNHPRTKSIDLAEEVAFKIRDTLAGLVSAQFYANDADEKKFARELLACRHIHCVLHLEYPKKSRLRPAAIDPASVFSALKKIIKAIDPHPRIVHGEAPDAVRMPWQVQRIKA